MSPILLLMCRTMKPNDSAAPLSCSTSDCLCVQQVGVDIQVPTQDLITYSTYTLITKYGFQVWTLWLIQFPCHRRGARGPWWSFQDRTWSQAASKRNSHSCQEFMGSVQLQTCEAKSGVQTERALRCRTSHKCTAYTGTDLKCPKVRENLQWTQVTFGSSLEKELERLHPSFLSWIKSVCTRQRTLSDPLAKMKGDKYLFGLWLFFFGLFLFLIFFCLVWFLVFIVFCWFFFFLRLRSEKNKSIPKKVKKKRVWEWTCNRGRKTWGN